MSQFNQPNPPQTTSGPLSVTGFRAEGETDGPNEEGEMIRESQGDLGDRAELEIENELQGQIDAIRAKIPRR